MYMYWLTSFCSCVRCICKYLPILHSGTNLTILAFTSFFSFGLLSGSSSLVTDSLWEFLWNTKVYCKYIIYYFPHVHWNLASSAVLHNYSDSGLQTLFLLKLLPLLDLLEPLYNVGGLFPEAALVWRESQSSFHSGSFSGQLRMLSCVHSTLSSGCERQEIKSSRSTTLLLHMLQTLWSESQVTTKADRGHFEFVTTDFFV